MDNEKKLIATRIIDEKLKYFRKLLIKSFLKNNEDIKMLSLHSIADFQEGNFSRTGKGKLLKLQLGFNAEQFVTKNHKGIPVKSEHWRIQPLVLCVWKEELNEDEK